MRRCMHFRSVTEAARALGIPRRDTERALDIIEDRREEVTEALLRSVATSLVHRPRGRRGVILGHPDVHAAAAAFGVTSAALYYRISFARRKGHALDKATLIDAYAPHLRRRGKPKGLGRNPKTWARVESQCGKLIEQCLAERSAA